MRVCIFGGGAIGGLIAARLALANEDVCVVARGAQFDEIERNGLQLNWCDGRVDTIRMRVVDRPSVAGKQDLVILAVKAHSLEQIADELPSLFGPQTTVMTLQNGIPWWYFQQHGGALEDTQLHSVDPSGALTQAVDIERIIAGVVYIAAGVDTPGVVRHVAGASVVLGEPSNAMTARLETITALLSSAGLEARTVRNIRSELWLKALGTLSFHPISALTGATMNEISEFPETRRLLVSMMEEARSVAGKFGVVLDQTAEQRIENARRVGLHKTSMLQDLENRRPLELEALVGSVLEMAKLSDTRVPSIESVYSLTKLLDRQTQNKLRDLETS